MERFKDAVDGGLDGCRGTFGCLGDLLGEVLLGLTACGVLALGWWGFQKAPYLTVSIASGILLFGAYGVLVFLRGNRGGGLVGRLTAAAVLTAGVVAALLSYLPLCDCL